jgi:hypothetical protein
MVILTKTLRKYKFLGMGLRLLQKPWDSFIIDNFLLAILFMLFVVFATLFLDG